MFHKMGYRLALDLGSTSLGWAMFRLNAENEPCAIIKAGVRIFSNGRNPKDGSSLAVIRREARGMRRRRDRLLKRKARMMRALVQYGFFPKTEEQRKVLEKLDPYVLRAKGLDTQLSPEEFGRALFHINQRRGFKSNRKTDTKDNESGALKTAINDLRKALQDEDCRTVGEWLCKRHQSGHSVRARYRENRIIKEDGKTKINKSYDLYIDRAMVETEFDVLWAKQAEFNPAQYTEEARVALRDTLLHQRPLKPVKPGRCTLLPDQERARLALPSTQRFRMYQDVNNLRILRDGLNDDPLTLEQRNKLIEALEKNNRRTFFQIKRLLGVGDVRFNFEDPKRQELIGNKTSAILGKAEHFGDAWFALDEEKQDAIVLKVLNEESEAKLIQWLQEETGIDEMHAEKIANVALPEGYGSLSAMALARILPELQRDVVTYDKAVKAAGFDHHSDIRALEKGEILEELPYYGQILERHIGFGSNNPEDIDEKRYGRIANPTVHIGLNQVRLVVNTLIKRYGHPSEVIIEVARDLKQSKVQREEENKRQAENQKRNEHRRKSIADILGINEERVRIADIQKMILWEELNSDIAERRCPYSGVQISASMLFSDAVEVEHILPYSRTLDDSLNNKTVSMRQANRIKGNSTPWEAFGVKTEAGFDYASILMRVNTMPKEKRYRFGENGYANWLKEDKDFVARALNDTRYMSRIATQYVGAICTKTRTIPGRMTAMLREKFGLNDVLGLSGIKNRNDHRHHAVDACVIGITDQSLLQRFAAASASARERQLSRLVEAIEPPWETYRDHVKRAIDNIKVSHKPDHGHEGAMHNDTAYRLDGNGKVSLHKINDEGKREVVTENLKVIEFTCAKAANRHGFLPDGSLKPYKGYKGDSNYCIEIVKNEKGRWVGEVISTFEAYQLAKTHRIERWCHPTLSASGKSLVMRLMRNDYIRLERDGQLHTMRVANFRQDGVINLASIVEANVDARNRDKEDAFSYLSKRSEPLRQMKARRVTISPIGEISDSGFKG